MIDAVNMSTKGKQSGSDEYELLWETGDTPPFEDQPEKILKDRRFPPIPKDKNSMDYKVYYDTRFTQRKIFPIMSCKISQNKSYKELFLLFE